MASKHWTNEEIEILKKYGPEKGVEYVANKVGRTIKSVNVKAARLGVSCLGGNWTKEEDEILRKYYPTEGSAGVAKRLKRRTREAVIQRAYKFKLESDKYALWTKKEEDILKKHYSTKGVEWCATKLNRTPQSIRARASLLGVKIEDRLWTEEEDNFIREFYPVKPVAWCAKKLRNRTKFAVNARALKLGVKRENRFWSEEELKYLRDNYGYETPAQIAKKLNRTKSAVLDMALINNLKFQREWTKEEEDFLIDNINNLPYKKICDHLKRARFNVYTKTKELGLYVDYYDDGYYYGTTDIAYMLGIENSKVIINKLKTSGLRISAIKNSNNKVRCYRFTPADIIRFLYKNPDLWINRMDEIDKHEINTLCIDETVKRRAYKECNFVVEAFNDTYWRKTAKLKADIDVLPDDIAI